MPKKIKKVPAKKTVTKKVPTKKTKTTTVKPSVVAAPVVVPQAPPVQVKTEAEKIWEEIQHKPIEMFALQNQFIYQHCTPVAVEPSKLYLTIRSTATLPSLEAAIGTGFTVELADKFVIIARVVVLPKPKK